MPLPLMDGDIKQCFCLTSVCLTSVAYIGPNSRTERHRKTNIGIELAHVTRDSDTTVKVKGQGHQALLVGCSNHYISYMDNTIIITRVSRFLSIMNIHGARCAERRRYKACMGWSWAAAFCVQGRGTYRASSRTSCFNRFR